MAPVIPHLDWPVRVGQHGHLRANEQDSLDDIATCCAISLLTPRGWRADEPQFGSRPGFELLPLNLSVIAGAVEADEPRATLELSDDYGRHSQLEAHVLARITQARGAA